MIVYKVRHIPTGLFYQPVKGRWASDKSNLSKRGKLYETRQYPKDLHTGGVAVSDNLRKEFNLPSRQTGYGSYIETSEKDWEVVEYKLKEINK